ncbi:hypothetical protein H4S06_001590, partial [Coemansia sp. BCRC 34490]
DEDESDDDEDDESSGSDLDEAKDEEKAVGAAGSKGKGKAAADEDEEHEEEEHEHEHEHGEHCSHSHDIVDIDEELPFDESEVSVNAASDGLKLLGEHKDKVVAMLEKTTGLSIDSFKSYHFPGRHYIVAWVGDFAVYGIRISYPMLIDDSDAEDASDDEDEDEDED